MSKSDLSEETELKKSGKIRWIVTGTILLILAISATVFLLYENNRVYGECYVEAGVEVTVQDFLREPDEQASFTGDSDTIDCAVPGEYHVRVKTGFFPHKSILYIIDSIAPTAEAVKVNLEIGKECEADLFVEQITDATAVTVSYVQEPDFSKSGIQEVKVMLTDAGGNQTEITSELFVSQVVEELTVEAGSAPPALKEFVIEGENASFITKIDGFDYTVPADKQVKLRVDGTDYTVTMHIVDTVPPKMNVKDIQSFTKVPRTPEDFVVSVEDVTEVALSFREEPDITAEGEQTVTVVATDKGGNETVKEARLTLAVDTEAPVITGVADLTVLAGSTVSYKKNVTVTDNCPEGLEFTVDNSAVNLSAEGEYPVVYIARDASGNETVETATVIVQPLVYDEREVYALADSVLAQIITPEMSQLEKVRAIYQYNITHIAYINHSEKESWVRAAYEGLVQKKGDCYVYACTAKVLLDRAGIHNMDIAKIPTSRNHYWNLVNLGDGWYHFDTTPRTDHPTIFMWTEEQLMAYSAQHHNSHNYDHTLYPEVN
ncbi:MAG: hypothetical protein HDQ96_09645 [Lachnospiraceae bacterium]|nr:hypothetical protein [Lachnospiraceae bacterium]